MPTIDTIAAPRFSVVVPTRNRPQYLKDAVLSILEQSFPDFELIVSDNSGDGDAALNQRLLAAEAARRKARRHGWSRKLKSSILNTLSVAIGRRKRSLGGAVVTGSTLIEVLRRDRMFAKGAAGLSVHG
jgi:hypothetical protein